MRPTAFLSLRGKQVMIMPLRPYKKEEEKCTVISISVPNMTLDSLDELREHFPYRIKRSTIIARYIKEGVEKDSCAL